MRLGNEAYLNEDASHSSTEDYAVECHLWIKLLVCVLEMWKVASEGRNISRGGVILREEEGNVENQAVGCAQIFGGLAGSHERRPSGEYLSCEKTYEKIQSPASTSLHKTDIGSMSEVFACVMHRHMYDAIGNGNVIVHGNKQ